MTVLPIAGLRAAPAPHKTTPRNRCAISQGPQIAHAISWGPRSQSAPRSLRLAAVLLTMLAKDGSS